jgi:serine/threonine protein kinase
MKFDGPLLDGRWRLGPRMGAGAQARTYLARDEKNPDGPPVVVKQLALGKGRGGTSWKKFDLFEREGRVLRSLRHPGIPRYLASFESEPGVFNLVMEKAPGASLRAIATRVRFDDADLRDVLVGVLHILTYLHSLSPPVIHRDIKPANLIRAADGAIALVDFGGVREALREDGGSTVVGTFGYMAPEQLHGEATAATDLYALGATIASLASGTEPEKIPRRGLRMDLTRHLRHVDPALVEILSAMTHPDPDERPQSAAEVLAMLRRAPALAPAPSAPPAQDSLMRRPADEMSDLLEGVPAPLAIFMRVLFLAVGVAGYVGLTVARVALLPLVFALIGALASAESRPRLTEARRQVSDALDEGRDGFRALQRRCMPGGRRQLPP